MVDGIVSCRPRLRCSTRRRRCRRKRDERINACCNTTLVPLWSLLRWKRASDSHDFQDKVFGRLCHLSSCGAVILLGPAVLAGRPFIFWDTWEFYSWGQDVLAAISNPWPAGQPFPIGRDLWASKVVLGLPATVDETQFRLTLSTIGSRSAFYAVPLYVLVLRSLWVAAGVQTLLVSWTLWLAVRAFGWRHHGLAFVGTAVTLTACTTLPFASAFLMPDIFAGLAVLAAGLLLFFPDRLSVSGRWGLSVLIAYAVVAHTSNIAR